MTTPYHPGAPSINGMDPREEIISGMYIINTLSMPFRAVDEAINLACGYTASL